MSKINDGGPAYPLHLGVLPDWQGQVGMSLRDAAALAAFPAIIAATSAGQHHPRKCEGETELIFAIARDAYLAADAFIVARAKGGADG